MVNKGILVCMMLLWAENVWSADVERWQDLKAQAEMLEQEKRVASLQADIRKLQQSNEMQSRSEDLEQMVRQLVKQAWEEQEVRVEQEPLPKVLYIAGQNKLYAKLISQNGQIEKVYVGSKIAHGRVANITPRSVVVKVDGRFVELGMSE